MPSSHRDHGEAEQSKKARVDLQSVPTRQYLDQVVVPVVLQGLSAVAKERYYSFKTLHLTVFWFALTVFSMKDWYGLGKPYFTSRFLDKHEDSLHFSVLLSSYKITSTPFFTFIDFIHKLIMLFYSSVVRSTYFNFPRCRPADPLEFLANFLLKNRPTPSTIETAPQETQSTSAPTPSI